jgi:hypothetical protein
MLQNSEPVIVVGNAHAAKDELVGVPII